MLTRRYFLLGWSCRIAIPVENVGRVFVSAVSILFVLLCVGELSTSPTLRVYNNLPFISILVVHCARDRTTRGVSPVIRT